MQRRIIERQPYYLIKVFFDGLLLLFSFGLAFYLKRGHLIIEARHKRYLIILFISWFVVTIFSKKFFFVEDKLFIKRIKPYLGSWITLVFVITILLYVFGWYHLSRFIVYGTLFLFLASELMMVLIGTILKGKKNNSVKITFQEFFMLLQPLFVLSAFVFIYYVHYKHLKIDENYVILFMCIFLIWMLVSLVIHRFKVDVKKNYLSAIYPFWKSQLAAAGIISVIIFLLNMPQFSRTVVLGSLITLAVMENIVVSGRFFAYRGEREEDEEMENIQERKEEIKSRLTESIEIEAQKYSPAGQSMSSDYLKNKLKAVYLNKYKKAFDFIEKNLDLEKFDIIKSIFIYSREIRNIELIENNSLCYFMNFELINNIRRLNKYFIFINKKMENGGVYVGRFESLEQRKERIFLKYQAPLAKGIYLLDFVFNRVMPKFPWIKRIYFFVTKGSNRPVSNTECLGRLYYCGFEVIAFQEVEGCCFFIAKKIKDPCQDPHPSYSLLLKQLRVGKSGEMIYVYKLRTMHPFAEYIHELVYDIKQLEDTGKIRDDFRVTSWGRVFRKKWVDELPMIINWLKGNLKIFGVRPLSETFFNTYPEELKRERIKYKPGLIPPYYVDMPNSIEEVWESERKYLEKYKRKPRKTDFVYFFKAVNNIVFHGAKSS